MILRLVWRSLLRRPGRSLLLLLGFALGVGVTLTLLGIGGALLESSRDRDLVGGGDLTVLPRGLDLETFRTGGVSSLYFSIEEAPFLYRQVLAGPRLRDAVAAAAPWMEDQLLYLETGDGARPISADGTIPGRAAALGVEPDVAVGEWSNLPADESWLAPSDSALYAGLDAFHLPSGDAAGDSTWAEWHYFNVLLPDREAWLYLTYMVTGQVPDGRWGGRLLATLVEKGPPGEGAAVRNFRDDVPARRVEFSTSRPDLELGGSTVRLGPDGTYRIRATIPPRGANATIASAGDARSGGDRGAAAGRLRVELRIRPEAGRYLPPLEVAGGSFPSGYTVPVLRGGASGSICVADACRPVGDGRAYHDHNWGVWRDVTWEWGEAQAGPFALVYGGVRRGEVEGSRFLFLTDSLGFAGLLPVERISFLPRPADGARGAPAGLRVLARRGPDSLLLDVDVLQARTSAPNPAAEEGASAAPGGADRFHQLFGEVRLRGRLRGEPVEARGTGFFETWTRPDQSG